MDTQHYLTAIKSRNGQTSFFCQTSRQEFDLVSGIVCQGEQELHCTYKELKDRDGRVTYKVDLANLPTGDSVFFALYNDGTRQRVWKPGPGLTRDNLPPQFYFTKYLNLSYSAGYVRRQLKKGRQSYAPVLKAIICDAGGITLQGLLFLPADYCDLESVEFTCIKFRQDNILFSSALELEEIQGEVFPGRPNSAFLEFNCCIVFRFHCVLDLASICHEPGSYNLFISHAGFPEPLRQVRKKALKKNLVHAHRLGLLRRALFIPYYDSNYHRWRLDVHHVSLFEWFKLRLLYHRTRFSPPERDPRIWLIGEYPTTARDNGMHFYNYMRKEHPEIDVYYILEQGAESSCLEDTDNVISYGSYKHFEISRRAGTLVFSHLPEYLVPKIDVFSDYENNFSSWLTFFIQHGVIAGRRKSLDNLYGIHVRKFDLFFVSSSTEKKIVTSSLGYEDRDVKITGLARWDKIKEKKSEQLDTILIIPTWRKYLQHLDTRSFKDSFFYSCWNSLLSNEKIHFLLKTNNTNIVFMLHTALYRFTRCFTGNNIIFANINNIQNELCRCRMLITDYSSVSFDVIYQGKPVIYFQFDSLSDEFNYAGQNFDFEKELPGPVCVDLDSTVDTIVRYVQNGFRLEPVYERRRDKFFAYLDDKNCERIYKNIQLKIQEHIH